MQQDRFKTFFFHLPYCSSLAPIVPPVFCPNSPLSDFRPFVFVYILYKHLYIYLSYMYLLIYIYTHIKSRVSCGLFICLSGAHFINVTRARVALLL